VLLYTYTSLYTHRLVRSTHNLLLNTEFYRIFLKNNKIFVQEITIPISRHYLNLKFKKQGVRGRSQGTVRWRALMNTIVNFEFQKMLNNYQLLSDSAACSWHWIQGNINCACMLWETSPLIDLSEINEHEHEHGHGHAIQDQKERIWKAHVPQFAPSSNLKY